MRKFTFAQAWALPQTGTAFKPFPTSSYRNAVRGQPTRMALRVVFSNRAPFEYVGKLNPLVWWKFWRWWEEGLVHSWLPIAEKRIQYAAFVEFDQAGVLRKQQQNGGYRDSNTPLRNFSLLVRYHPGGGAVSDLQRTQWRKRVVGPLGGVHTIYWPTARITPESLVEVKRRLGEMGL